MSHWNIPVEGRHFSHFHRLFELLKTKNRSSYVVPGTYVRINYKKEKRTDLRTYVEIQKGKKNLMKTRNFLNFRETSYIRFLLKTQVFEKFSGTYIRMYVRISNLSLFFSKNTSLHVFPYTTINGQETISFVECTFKHWLSIVWKNILHIFTYEKFMCKP